VGMDMMDMGMGMDRMVLGTKTCIGIHTLGTHIHVPTGHTNTHDQHYVLYLSEHGH
jgi:hypothetical protein